MDSDKIVDKKSGEYLHAFVTGNIFVGDQLKEYGKIWVKPHEETESSIINTGQKVFGWQINVEEIARYMPKKDFTRSDVEKFLSKKFGDRYSIEWLNIPALPISPFC